jgi:hypothetical protein
MENLYPTTSNQAPELIIDLPIRTFLAETSRWGKFIAILGFISSGLIALIAVFLMITPSIGLTARFTASFGWIIGPVYLLMALLYFFPSRYLYIFSSNINTALFSNDQDALSTGFENLKSNFKFWGILLIVMIGFYVLAIVGSIAALAFNA